MAVRMADGTEAGRYSRRSLYIIVGWLQNHYKIVIHNYKKTCKLLKMHILSTTKLYGLSN